MSWKPIDQNTRWLMRVFFLGLETSFRFVDPWFSISERSTHEKRDYHLQTTTHRLVSHRPYQALRAQQQQPLPWEERELAAPKSSHQGRADTPLLLHRTAVRRLKPVACLCYPFGKPRCRVSTVYVSTSIPSITDHVRIIDPNCPPSEIRATPPSSSLRGISSDGCSRRESPNEGQIDDKIDLREEIDNKKNRTS